MNSKSFLALIMLSIQFISCSSSRTPVTEWTRPYVNTEMGNLNKVLIIAYTDDEKARLVIEDSLALLLEGSAFASHTYDGLDIYRDNEKDIRTKAANNGFDGIVTVHIGKVEREASTRPGQYTYTTYKRGAGGGLQANKNNYYSANKFTTKHYAFEVFVYSVKFDKVVLLGVAESKAPDKLLTIAGNAHRLILEKMKDEGLISR